MDFMDGSIRCCAYFCLQPTEIHNGRVNKGQRRYAIQGGVHGVLRGDYYGIRYQAIPETRQRRFLYTKDSVEADAKMGADPWIYGDLLQDLAACHSVFVFPD